MNKKTLRLRRGRKLICLLQEAIWKLSADILHDLPHTCCQIIYIEKLSADNLHLEISADILNDLLHTYRETGYTTFEELPEYKFPLSLSPDLTIQDSEIRSIGYEPILDYQFYSAKTKK